MKKKKPSDNQISVYQTPDGSINIEVLYANENIWLSQKRMAELFGCTADNISLHLKNIYQESELDSEATTEDFSVVQKEGIQNQEYKKSRWASTGGKFHRLPP